MNAWLWKNRISLGIVVGFGILALLDLLIEPNYHSLLDRDLVLFNTALVVLVAFLFVVVLDWFSSNIWYYNVTLYAFAALTIPIYFLGSTLFVVQWRILNIPYILSITAVLATPIIVYSYTSRRRQSFLTTSDHFKKYVKIVVTVALTLLLPVLLVLFFGLSLMSVFRQLAHDREETNSVENERYLVTQFYYYDLGVTTVGNTDIVVIDKQKWPRRENRLYSGGPIFDKIKLEFCGESQDSLKIYLTSTPIIRSLRD